MVHPDRETHLGAHRIFSVVLVPSSVCPHGCSAVPDSPKMSDLRRTLSRTVSVFSSSAALFEKLKRDKFSSRGNGNQDSQDNVTDAKLYKLQSSKSRIYSMKGSSLPSAGDKHSSNNSPKDMVFYFVNKSYSIFFYYYFFMIIVSCTIFGIHLDSIPYLCKSSGSSSLTAKQSSDYSFAFINICSGDIP